MTVPLGRSRYSTSGLDVNPDHLNAAMMPSGWTRNLTTPPDVAVNTRHANASLILHHPPRTARNRLPRIERKSVQKSTLKRNFPPNFTVASGNDQNADTLGHLSVCDFGYGARAAGSGGRNAIQLALLPRHY
jgi:hypothetical protein